MIVGGRDNDKVLTVTSQLMIVHYLQNCVLTTSGKQLPKWGFEQQEVSCNPNVRDRNAIWNIEDNVFDKCKYLHCNNKGWGKFLFLSLFFFNPWRAYYC